MQMVLFFLHIITNNNRYWCNLSLRLCFFKNRIIIMIERLKSLSSEFQDLISGRLWLKVIIALVLGVVTGFIMGPEVGIFNPSFSNAATNWIAFPGHLFISLIQMIVIPLVVGSIIIGITSVSDPDKLKSMGLYLVLYFVATTVIAVSIGLGAAFIIKPGTYITVDAEQLNELENSDTGPAVISIQDIPNAVVDLIPKNPLSDMVAGNMLGIVIFSIIIGLALSAMKKDTAKPMIILLASLQEVCITVVKWAMKLVPVAVFGLMTRLTATAGFGTLKGMGIYVITVLLGLMILLMVYYIIILFITKQNPGSFFKKIRDVQLLAFSTSSSAAVMPVSIKKAEDELGVSPSVSRLIIPVGATINMDGTALYQAVATIFLAQAFGVTLDTSGIILLVITSVAASIGAPSAPGVGIVILASILTSVGVPATGIALIISVDRILDMTRTAVNVTGDLTATVVFNKWFGNDADDVKNGA
jgi:Na+/H+-dicarboxylate symporter